MACQAYGLVSRYSPKLQLQIAPVVGKQLLCVNAFTVALLLRVQGFSKQPLTGCVNMSEGSMGRAA